MRISYHFVLMFMHLSKVTTVWDLCCFIRHRTESLWKLWNLHRWQFSRRCSVSIDQGWFRSSYAWSALYRATVGSPGASSPCTHELLGDHNKTFVAQGRWILERTRLSYRRIKQNSTTGLVMRNKLSSWDRFMKGHGKGSSDSPIRWHDACCS